MQALVEALVIHRMSTLRLLHSLFRLDLRLDDSHYRRIDTWVRTELHHKIEREPIVRPAEERQEQLDTHAHVDLSPQARLRAIDEQGDVSPCLRKHAANEM